MSQPTWMTLAWLGQKLPQWRKPVEFRKFWILEWHFFVEILMEFMHMQKWGISQFQRSGWYYTFFSFLWFWFSASVQLMWEFQITWKWWNFLEFCRWCILLSLLSSIFITQYKSQLFSFLKTAGLYAFIVFVAAWCIFWVLAGLGLCSEAGGMIWVVIWMCVVDL